LGHERASRGEYREAAGAAIADEAATPIDLDPMRAACGQPCVSEIVNINP
jgi:hypothetical protein